MRKFIGKDVQVVDAKNPYVTPMGNLLEIDLELNGIYIGPLKDAENLKEFNGINILTWIPNRKVDMLCELKPQKLDADKKSTSKSKKATS